MNLFELKWLKVNDEGKFGKVFQVNLINSNKVYAMRAIQKLPFYLYIYTNNDRTDFFKKLKQERKIRLLECRFIVKTKAIFESKVFFFLFQIQITF